MIDAEALSTDCTSSSTIVSSEITLFSTFTYTVSESPQSGLLPSVVHVYLSSIPKFCGFLSDQVLFLGLDQCASSFLRLLRSCAIPASCCSSVLLRSCGYFFGGSLTDRDNIHIRPSYRL